MYGRNNEKGAAIVEFALILPFLLLLVFGIVQFGFIFNGQITLTSAVREGARFSVVGNTETDVKQKVIDSSTALLLRVLEDDISVVEEVDANGNETKKVVATGTVDIIMPFLDFFTGNSITLTAESIMRNEKSF